MERMQQATESMNAKQFEKIFDDYSGKLFTHAFFRVSDREKAKDLVQETFMKAWTSLKNIEYRIKNKKVGEDEPKTIENWKSFLYTILNNLIIDHYRAKKSLSLDEMAESGGGEDGEGGVGGTVANWSGRTPEGLKTGGLEEESERYDASVTSLQIRQALEGLGEVDRRLVTLRFLEELPTAEVAELMHMQENAVYVRSHRALKKLKVLLTTTKDMMI